MILEPINDVDCMGQLTVFARELAPSTLVRDVAERLGTRAAVIQWLQSLPQADDTGDEQVRVIQCDVPQRVRLFPDDPNCVERSLAALVLLEVIAPKTPRALATVDKPLRHTGLVEQYGKGWHAVDLFPRRNAGARNFDWKSFGLTALHTGHSVGGNYLEGWGNALGGSYGRNLVKYGVDLLGSQEARLDAQKKGPLPPTGAQRAPQSGNSKSIAIAAAGSGAGANQTKSTVPVVGAGAKNATQESVARGARGDSIRFGPRRRGPRAEAGQAEARSDRDPHDARDRAQRLWRSLGW